MWNFALSSSAFLKFPPPAHWNLTLWVNTTQNFKVTNKPMKFSYRDRQPILCFRNYTERATSICLPALFTHALFVKFCLVKRSANFKISARLNLPRQRQGRGKFEIWAWIVRLATCEPRAKFNEIWSSNLSFRPLKFLASFRLEIPL